MEKKKERGSYLSDKSGETADESLAGERKGASISADDIPEVLVADDPDGRVEEVPEKSWGQALVEPQWALLAHDLRGHPERVGPAGRGLAVELKPGLRQVYRERRRLRHHGRE